MIGIRAHWSCATCGLRADTRQFAYLGEELKMDPPPNWAVVDRVSFCGHHHDQPKAAAGLSIVRKSA